MAKYPTLPKELHHLVPSGDGRQPCEAVEGGRYVVAGRRALILLDSERVIDSGLWHEVQFAKWVAEDRKLTVVWTQPNRPPVRETTLTDDAGRLMEAITIRTERTILATRSFFTQLGVRVSATVRRRPDGELFSVLIADGQISAEEMKRGEEIELSLRQELGMDDA